MSVYCFRKVMLIFFGMVLKQLIRFIVHFSKHITALGDI